ncbi:acetone carboxylase subunit gamma [Chloroflexota bacterium]
MRVRITEYLDIDLDKELWCCHSCGKELGSARENYKHFTLVYDRDPHGIHKPYIEPGSSPFGHTCSPDPEWCRILEFYCPGCATMFEAEYLPPGHPPTHDIELDIDALKARHEFPAVKSLPDP